MSFRAQPSCFFFIIMVIYLRFLLSWELSVRRKLHPWERFELRVLFKSSIYCCYLQGRGGSLDLETMPFWCFLFEILLLWGGRHFGWYASLFSCLEGFISQEGEGFWLASSCRGSGNGRQSQKEMHDVWGHFCESVDFSLYVAISPLLCGVIFWPSVAL